MSQKTNLKYFLGKWFILRKKWLHAKKHICLAILLESNRYDMWFSLGFVAMHTKDFSVSLFCFMKTLEYKWLSKYAWDNIAILHSLIFIDETKMITNIKKIFRSYDIIQFPMLKKFIEFSLNIAYQFISNIIIISRNFHILYFSKFYIENSLYRHILIIFFEIFKKPHCVRDVNFFKRKILYYFLKFINYISDNLQFICIINSHTKKINLIDDISYIEYIYRHFKICKKRILYKYNQILTFN